MQTEAGFEHPGSIRGAGLTTGVLRGKGKHEEAREFYRKGIEAARRAGDAHAAAEMQAALDLLG